MSAAEFVKIGARTSLPASVRRRPHERETTRKELIYFALFRICFLLKRHFFVVAFVAFGALEAGNVAEV